VSEPDPSALARHYGGADLGEAILRGLRALGKDPEAPTVEDLAAVDQFHSMGRAATIELARLAAVAPGAEVLDVGGGLGGAARVLARELGCRVTVLDYTEAFCRVGADLTRRTGLERLVAFRHGSALAMPFPDHRFDVVWSQHSSMNVEDKPRLCAEVRRVLRPGGRLALHEIMAGPHQPIHFPVPWARDRGLSFLATPAEVRRLLAAQGLVELEWRDRSAPSREWFRERIAAGRGATASPPLGVHLMLGPDAGRAIGNLLRNLDEERVVVIMAVFRG
jgi:SAM-dependent methyltransferase